MLYDPDPVTPGTTGTVAAVPQQRTWAQVDVEWDKGRTSMLVVPPDEFEVLAGEDKHADRSLEIDDICQTLKMSRSTFYRYVRL